MLGFWDVGVGLEVNLTLEDVSIAGEGGPFPHDDKARKQQVKQVVAVVTKTKGTDRLALLLRLVNSFSELRTAFYLTCGQRPWRRGECGRT